MTPLSSDGGNVTCGGVARSRASWIDYLQRVGSTLLLTYLAVGVTGVDGPPQTLSKQALEAKASGAARHSPHADMFNALSRVDSSACVRHAARGAAAEARQLRPGSGDASAAARAHAMLAAPPARPSASCG